MREAQERPMLSLQNARVPLLGIAAYSGTGKTTLLKQLIPLLRASGLEVGLIKHAHHAFDVDYPGKDSYELRKAGANPVMLSSSHRRALMTEHREPRQPTLAGELAHFDQTGLGLVLVEGFKRERFPKIELSRPVLGHPLLYPEDDSIIAVATDAPLPGPPPIPVLDLNDPAGIARFILQDFLPHAAAGPLR
jgi:molybdopterin-guanine dinucleotide biosynthesis protein B